MKARGKALLALFAFALGAVAIALGGAGCAGARVVGIGDVELTYEAESAPGPAPFAEDLRALVLRRLVAARVGADVTEDGRRVRLVVDEETASLVDELVTWPGSLAVVEPDPSYVLVPPPTSDAGGLVQRTEARADGRLDQYWEGPRAAVARAAAEWRVDRDHRIVIEPRWETAHGTADARWRTRVVRAAVIGELGDGIMVGRGEGGTLRLRAPRGTPSAEVIRDARAWRTSPVVVRGRTSLGAPAFTEDSAILAFGAGVRAYARAQEERLLLTTPRLPPMRRVGSLALPPNDALAAACVFVPLLLSLGWLLFVRRFDRAHPEPFWLVGTTFLFGAASTVPAGIVEHLLTRLSPWLDPRVVTFGGQVFALPIAFVVFTLVVGLVEEGAKLAGAAFALRRPEFDEPIDGVVYGVVSSLGFAAAENFHYLAAARLSAPTVIARTFMSIPAHMFFGALWGYALGARLVDVRARVAPMLAVSAAAHGLFDALLSTDGAGALAVVLEVGLASAFVVLVRRALRFGVVEDSALAVRADERRMFRVGRPGMFALASVSLHVLAFGIFVLGAWYQLARHRPGEVFVAGSSVLVALLAVAAHGVATALPLDVVVDDYGVTFAGAARPWRRIRGFSEHGDHLMLDCDGGPIRLGPGDPRTVKEMARALDEHVGERGRLRALQRG